MDRRGFLRLVGGTIVVLPLGTFLVHCGSSDAPEAPPMRSGTSVVYTSSASSTGDSHSHTFSIDDTVLASPPAAGLSGDTSVFGGHSHGVVIAQADLANIAAGESVKITTSSVGHTHVFTFVKVA